ncbi:MAG: hypothetical protein JO249_05775 [Acidobacteria bacterium]|nr:hypothetical protein [Acidobacteriota bacterium]
MSLPEKARAVVLLRDQEDLDPEDIARVPGSQSARLRVNSSVPSLCCAGRWSRCR